MTDIKTLNDNFCKTFTGGQVLLTAGIDSMDAEDVANIMLLVQNFNDFTPDNDPYGEHDFGSFMYNSNKIFWKIDYYDRFNTCYASENPADPTITKRILTIMLADEW